MSYLVLQRAEARDARLDPVGLITQLDLRVRLGHQAIPEDRRFGGGHFQPEDEVRTMSGSTQCARSRQYFVDGAPVDAAIFRVRGPVHFGNQVDHGHRCKQFFRFWIR